jgi:predicted nucleotide-binding protein with TIR-like domain
MKGPKMTFTSNHFVIFFAWQDDSPPPTNKQAIRAALRAASTRLEQEFGSGKLGIELQEATKGEPGSPNIPAKILEKIERSDIFVCDLTTVIKQTTPSAIAAPNPNVIFELGYAVARLGWSRIIILFNEAFGSFPDELPFDVDRHRASRYTLKDGPDVKKAYARATLDDLLVEALKAIIVAKPEKPSGKKELTLEEIRRIRDLDALRRVLAKIHWPTIDKHIEDAPRTIHDSVFYFWEGFNAVLTSSLFHLYDESLLSDLEKIHQLWGKTLSYGHCYHTSLNRDVVIFDLPGDMFINAEHRQAWGEITEALIELRKASDAVLNRIRDRYPEIDLVDINRSLEATYADFKNDLANPPPADVTKPNA